MKLSFLHRVMRPLTLRSAVALWMVTISAAWIVLVVGWAIANIWSVHNHHAGLTTDIQAVNVAHRLEIALLGYRREDLLWHATKRTDYRQLRDEYLGTARQTAESLGLYSPSQKEQAIVIQIQEAMEALEGQIRIPSPIPPESEVQLTEEVLTDVRELRQGKEMLMHDSIETADRLYRRMTYWTLGLLAATALMLFGGGWRFTRRVIRPVLALSRAAEDFGCGDLTRRAPVLYNDELGALARTFNNMALDISNREKKRVQFVAMVVHDLKNPVHAIDIAARLLSRPELSMEDRKLYLSGVMQETEKLKRIIRELIDDAQVATGHFSLHKTNTDVGLLVRRLVEAQSNTEAGHEIDVEAPAGCIVQADVKRMERVVTNLLSNAIKYSPHHTRVTVRVARNGAQARLTVSDEGPGIANEDLRVVFQPFGRGRSAGTLAEGAGMGLYVVKQIVKAHGGRVEVQSQLGHGTTFLVDVPLIPPARPK
jgi:signal transduction histidine kinase